MVKLTEKQQRIYDFMMKFFVENQSMPTMQEIADKFNFDSLNSSQDHVKSICRKGFLIKRRVGYSRKHRYTFSKLTVKLEPACGMMK